MCGLHCFRQCTRTIHSAHSRITLTELSQECGRTPSVRRQSAAKSGHSPESPPSPWNLTGKLFRSYSIEPFMVELFIAERLTRSPEQSMPSDEVVITDKGSSVARLTPIMQTQLRTPRQPGTLRGTVLYCAPDFDAPLNEFQEYTP